MSHIEQILNIFAAKESNQQPNMRHARIFIFPVLMFLGVLLLGDSACRNQDVKSQNTSAVAGSTNGKDISYIPKSERKKMTDSERLRWLEQYGQVPEDAEIGDMDWHLAQMTSWWGKPLDPTQFWRDRVVWCDADAEAAARRRGREWPPIPNGYEKLLRGEHSADDKIDWGTFQVEGPNIHFAGSSKENAFWDKFAKTMPSPPENLKREQYNLAKYIVEDRFSFERGIYPARMTAERQAEAEANIKQDYIHLGSPQEMVSSNALFWAYVFKERENYAKYVLPRTNHPAMLSRYFAKLPIASNYVTEPLTEEWLKSANAWKLTYLQRLRREKTDESYINAYLKAWNLSENEVFGESI